MGRARIPAAARRPRGVEAADHRRHPAVGRRTDPECGRSVYLAPAPEDPGRRHYHPHHPWLWLYARSGRRACMNSIRLRLLKWLIGPILLFNLTAGALTYLLAWIPAQSAFDQGLLDAA